MNRAERRKLQKQGITSTDIKRIEDTILERIGMVERSLTNG